MPYPELDRFAIRLEPLAARPSKFAIATRACHPGDPPRALTDPARRALAELAERVHAARQAHKPVMCTFGAHAIKNGLGPVLAALAEKGWLTHLATNGAGIIHDWEFAFQGASCEDVAAMMRDGRFGNWQETGFYLNLAFIVGAYEAKGYGEAIGALIHQNGLTIPSAAELEQQVAARLAADPQSTAAAADLLWAVRRFDLPPGRLAVPHPHPGVSAQAAAYRLGVPFTGHPMIGHDIIYNHPMNSCAALGRCAQRDFLRFAASVSRIDGGVYISLGSAVMSPMVFEKSLAMAQNLARQEGRHLTDHFILAADLAASRWDWQRGEPPPEDPEYYLRYNKTFSRMGGTMRYLQADNRDFLLALRHGLR
jgi:hypothetical protein